MGSLSSDDDEESQFFDPRENIATASGSESDCLDCLDSGYGLDNRGSSSSDYNLWVSSPRSVKQRRNEFLLWMELNVDMRLDELIDTYGDDVYEGDIDRIVESSGAVLGTSGFEAECSPNKYSSSGSICCSDFPRRSGSEDSSLCKIGNSDGRTPSNEDNLGVDGLRISEKLDSTSAPPSLVYQLFQRESQVADNVLRVRTRTRVKNWWLRRLHSMSAILERMERGNDLGLNSSNPFLDSKVQRVRVRYCRKRPKELSALFTGQDIQAHAGSILTMKFSPDGQYLASAGEDKVIRVWQVVEKERSNEIDIPDIDPSCIYFTVNHFSELTPLVTEKNKMNKIKSPKKTADSAYVIFPPKVFRILEKALHEFCGHDGEVLDLSWSNNNHLLSSSVDKTVRLWQVGCEECLKVFSHSNYVTCIQFNPVNDNYFISGSIDGKVRIWAVDRRQVVDWIDVKDIVTAVTYQPDAKAGIVGSLLGNCRYFNISDNHFHLEEQICLNSKNKSPYKGITGFQFFPQDPRKVMVTSGDSQAIILKGNNIVQKYRGPRNAGNLISAFFTSDGNYIVSASEDSNIYLWRCSSLEDFSLSSLKKIKSFECFPIDASIAIPWSGLKLRNSPKQWQYHVSNESSFNTLHFSPSAYFWLNQEYFLEAIPKGSGTWPEEKLPSSSPQDVPSILCKSHYKFFRNSCQNSSSSHAWGLVIVTGGWDGRIRSFHNYGLPIPL